MALAFVQNSNYAYYPRKLTSAQTWLIPAAQHLAQGGGGLRAAERARLVPFPGAEPGCRGRDRQPYGAPLVFDRPVKAVFSADGGTAYVLNCGPECGGNDGLGFAAAGGADDLPDRPAVRNFTHQYCAAATARDVSNARCIPGGASNALVNDYHDVCRGPAAACRRPVCRQSDGRESRRTITVTAAPISISDGRPGAPSRMMRGGRQYAVDRHDEVHQRRALCHGPALRLPDHVQHATNTVTMLEPYLGDATGIAAVTGLHKIYSAQGGQVYIYPHDGRYLDRQPVRDRDRNGLRRGLSWTRPPTPTTPFTRSDGRKLTRFRFHVPMFWPSRPIATTWNKPAAAHCCAWRRADCAQRFWT